MERTIGYQVEGSAKASAFISNRRLRRDENGALICGRPAPLAFGTHAIMGAGKSQMMSLTLEAPSSHDTISLVIAPGKGDNARQLYKSLKKRLGERVIYLDSATARGYIPRRGDILVTSAEQLVGRDSDGKNIKTLSSERIGDKSIWSIARNASALSIEIVVFKDEAHIQGPAYVAWRNQFSEHAGYPLITMEYTATPEDTSSLTDRFDVLPKDAVEAELVRGLYAQNVGLVEYGENGKYNDLQSGIASGYARILLLRDLARQHMEKGTCKDGECAMVALPKVIVQAESIKQIKEYVSIIEEITGGKVTEKNGGILVKYSGYVTEDADGNEIDPSSINDADSPVIFVVHHDALNEGFNAPCLQVFVTNFSSKSPTHAVQGFGRVVRTHGGHAHDDEELNIIYIYSNVDNLGFRRFKESLNQKYIFDSALVPFPEFESDIESAALPCSNAFRGDRNKIIFPKDGEPAGLTFLDALKEAYVSKLPVTRIDTICVDGSALLISEGEISEIATAEDAPDGSLSGNLSKRHTEVRKSVMSWVQTHIVSGRGFGANNRLVELVIEPALKKVFTLALEDDPSIAASGSGLAGFDGLSDEAVLSYAMHSSIKHWEPAISGALDRFVPDPEGEKKDVAYGTLKARAYVEGSALVGNLDADKLPPVSDLPWAMKCGDRPFRSRETTIYEPEKLAEKFISKIEGIRWVHKNDKLRVENSMGIAYLYEDGRGATSYPDYLISRDIGDDVQIIIMEVKDYSDRGEKCERIAKTLRSYSEMFGIPACVMMTDGSGDPVAYLGNDMEVPMSDFLARDWRRTSIPVTHEVMTRIAKS